MRRVAASSAAPAATASEIWSLASKAQCRSLTWLRTTILHIIDARWSRRGAYCKWSVRFGELQLGVCRPTHPPYLRAWRRILAATYTRACNTNERAATCLSFGCMPESAGDRQGSNRKFGRHVHARAGSRVPQQSRHDQHAKDMKALDMDGVQVPAAGAVPLLAGVRHQQHDQRCCQDQTAVP